MAALECPLSFSRTTSRPAAFDFVVELFDERWKAISETVMFGYICRPPLSFFLLRECYLHGSLLTVEQFRTVRVHIVQGARVLVSGYHGS